MAVPPDIQVATGAPATGGDVGLVDLVRARAPWVPVGGSCAGRHRRGGGA